MTNITMPREVVEQAMNTAKNTATAWDAYWSRGRNEADAVLFVVAMDAQRKASAALEAALSAAAEPVKVETNLRKAAIRAKTLLQMYKPTYGTVGSRDVDIGVAIRKFESAIFDLDAALASQSAAAEQPSQQGAQEVPLGYLVGLPHCKGDTDDIFTFIPLKKFVSRPDWNQAEILIGSYASTSPAPAVPDGYVSVIDVEKLLCEKLGIQWSATGISIVSLIDRLAVVPDAAKPGSGSADLETIIDNYLDGYELRDDPACHTPSEFERLLIKDAIMGLLVDEDWDSTWGAHIASIAAERAAKPGQRSITKEEDAVLRRATAAASTLVHPGRLVTAAKPEPCRDKTRAIPGCKNRHQCWEPCGELGHRAEHARPAPKETQDAVNAALGLAAKPETQGERAELIREFENAVHRKGELFERCQGKGWPEAESTAFRKLRDETIPTLRVALLSAGPARVEPLTDDEPPDLGDYVLATKYSDGDPGDAWALGFYAGELDMGNDRCEIKVAPRYMVKDGAGNNIRWNGYRRVARIRKDVGAWLLNVAAKQLEQSPPGTVNLWTMLTPAAFDAKGIGKDQA